jgi:hypothetical protein
LWNNVAPRKIIGDALSTMEIGAPDPHIECAAPTIRSECAHRGIAAARPPDREKGKEDQMKATTTTPPTRPRLPTPSEQDEMSGRGFLEAFRKVRQEQKADRAKLVHMLKERAWDLACHRTAPGHA